MKTKTLQKFHINQTHIFWACVGIIAMLIFSYIYFVNITIFHTADRSNIEESITDLKSSISQLELELIDETRTVTLEEAYDLGFRDVKSPVFVKRDHNTRLTINDL